LSQRHGLTQKVYVLSTNHIKPFFHPDYHCRYRSCTGS
jgi:hypothetical protein